MRLLLLALFMLGCYTPLSKAEIVAVKKTRTSSDLKFLEEYDAKIKAMNNYTVTFSDGQLNKKPPAKHLKSSGGFEVVLVKVNRKS